MHYCSYDANRHRATPTRRYSCTRPRWRACQINAACLSNMLTVVVPLRRYPATLHARRPQRLGDVPERPAMRPPVSINRSSSCSGMEIRVPVGCNCRVGILRERGTDSRRMRHVFMQTRGYALLFSALIRYATATLEPAEGWLVGTPGNKFTNRADDAQKHFPVLSGHEEKVRVILHVALTKNNIHGSECTIPYTECVFVVCYVRTV